MLKFQQRFKMEKYNVFPEDLNKIALSANNEKKNTINRFDRNTYIWNEQRPSMEKRKN